MKWHVLLRDGMSGTVLEAIRQIVALNQKRVLSLSADARESGLKTQEYRHKRYTTLRTFVKKKLMDKTS